MTNPNKVLITGATGFIGSNLTRRLIQESFEVGIIKREKSDTWRIKDLIDKTVTYNVDLRDTQGVSNVIRNFRPDVILHLAAEIYNPQETSLMIDTNVLGTVNLLKASKDSIAKLFVNTSSCFVYKESKDKLKENADLTPLNFYALTKIQAEQACSFYAERHKLKTVTLRLFPPYGPADHEKRLIPYVIKNFLKDERPKLTTGWQRWDFVYVDDVVDVYFKLLSIPDFPQKHEIFNIGAANAVSVREVVSRIKKIIGTTLEPDWGAIPHRKSEVWYICADIGKAKTILRWEPKVQILGEGLELTVKWYENFWKREDENGEKD